MAVVKDMFGFLTVPLTEDEQLARHASSLRAKKLVKAWQSVNPAGAAGGQEPRAASLKPLIRKGIPFEYRPSMWYLLSGASSKRSMYPVEHYQIISSQTPSAVEVRFAIEEDVRNSFRQHALFQSPQGLAALRRLLFAFYHHTAEAGYCRGLVHMAVFVLVVFGLHREEEAFWVLIALLEGKLLTSPTEQVALAAKVEQKVLERLVQKKLPKLYQHVSRTDGGFTALTSTWFSCAFTTALPAETTVRVWDALMLEGRKVLLRVAIALLKKYEGALLSCTREEAMKRVLETRCIRTYDDEVLLQLAFKGIGSMPNATINTIRCEACKDVALRQEQLHLRLSGVLTHVM